MDPGLQTYQRMAAQRVSSDKRLRARFRHEALSDIVEDAPNPHADTASSHERRLDFICGTLVKNVR
jgi:hypothetical protein